MHRNQKNLPPASMIEGSMSSGLPHNGSSNHYDNLTLLQKCKVILRDVLPTALVAYLLFGVIFNVVFVSGPSMEPTLHNGNILIIRSVFYSPQRGDIVVANPENYDAQIVKRVIAVGGDTIDIDYDSGLVYLNGEVIQEEYVNSMTNIDHGTVLPLVVPEGYVFIMGDNRNNSYDSRCPEIGLVSTKEVKGGLFFKFGN